MSRHNPRDARFEHILLVMDPAELTAERSANASALDRAVQLCRAFGGRLELFHACHDPTLELRLFSDRDEVAREKEQAANRAATQLAEIALEVSRSGIEVTHEARWDHPRPDAILRKIHDCRPDLVIKASDGPNFVLGLSDQTDWELIRNSPTHLWFAKRGKQGIETVLTSIGGDDAGNVFAPSDHEVYQVSNAVAGALHARNQAVHTFQVPRLYAYATYSPALAGAETVTRHAEAWEDIARAHGKALREFADSEGIDPASIRVSKGHPAEVLPELAEETGAGLVVMGARNLSRWERLFSSVTAEPVLSEAPCDVLFVKTEADAASPERRPAKKGVPEVDLEMAILHPDRAFRTPAAVVESGHLSAALRRRILDAWEHDVEAELTEEDEGGPVKPSRAALLEEISAARAELREAA